MSDAPTLRNSRRSTRVPIEVEIEVESGDAPLHCKGETLVVNLHGALIATSIALTAGMRVSIHVLMTDKRSPARVVYVDPNNPLHCGVELNQPRNIWGVPLPPEDWDEMADLHASH